MSKITAVLLSSTLIISATGIFFFSNQIKEKQNQELRIEKKKEVPQRILDANAPYISRSDLVKIITSKEIYPISFQEDIVGKKYTSSSVYDFTFEASKGSDGLWKIQQNAYDIFITKCTLKEEEGRKLSEARLLDVFTWSGTFTDIYKNFEDGPFYVEFSECEILNIYKRK